MISSDSTQNMQNTFDTGPLSWVMAETREALMHVKRALHDATQQSAESQSTLLKHAKLYLHQAHGALQMVDVDGVALLSENIEVLLNRMGEGQLDISVENVAPIEQALDAIQEYLDELVVSGKQQPVKLFPCYRNLMTLKGVDRVNPTDLFFPALLPQTPLGVLSTVAEDGTVASATKKNTAASYANIRLRFEKALLPFLKQSERTLLQASARNMQGLIAEIWHVQANAQARSFWAVMHGFAELVAVHGLFEEQSVKQLFGRINLQIRRLHEGAISIPDSLLRDALFFIARADNLPPNAENVRRCYQLDGQVPANFEIQSFGAIEPGVLSISKERLAQIKLLWSKIASGENGLFAKFEQKMNDLAEVGIKLKSPPLSKLLRELTGLTRHVMQARLSDEFAMGMATSLLFIESALDQITHLPADFSERADLLAARLLAIVSGEVPDKTAPWLDEMSREAQQRQTMSALVGEMQSSLRIVEKTLDDYFRAPAEPHDLVQIDPILHQIAGALAILDQDEANAALTYTQNLIRTMAVAEQPTDPAMHIQVAQNIGALSFLIEALQSQPDTAKNKFSFDPESGYFKSHFLDAPVVATQPDNDVPVSAPHASAVVEEATPVSTEYELVEQQKQSAQLASSLQEQPHNAEIQAQLLASLEQERSVARLLADPDASERASNAIDVLAQTDFNVVEPELHDIISAVETDADSIALPSIPAHAPIPVGDDAIDAELLEVFLMEADEVLACVNETIPLSKSDPSNQDHLITLRRSFHTLKGSGRMVGLGAFGNAAWSVEQVMNSWLSDARHGNDDLYALLEKASHVLGAWVAELNAMGTSDFTGLALIESAEQIKNGAAYSYLESQQPEPAFSVAVVAVEAATETETEVAEVPAEFESALAPVVESQAEPAADTSVEDVIAAYAAVDVEVATSASAELTIPEIDFSLPTEPLLTPVHDYLEAAPEATQVPISDTEILLPEFDLIPELTDTVTDIEPDPVAHTEPEVMLDTPADAVTDEALEAVAAELAELDAELAELDAELALAPPESTFEHIDVPVLENEFPENVIGHIEPADDAVVVAAVIAEAQPHEAQIIDFPSHFTPFEDTVKKIGNIEIGVPLYNIYLAETDEIVRFLSQDFSEWRHEPHRPVTMHAVHAAHSLAGSSATVGFASLQQVAHALEMVLQRLERHPVMLLPGEFDTLDRCVVCVKEMLLQFALAEMAPFKPEQILVLEQLLAILTDRAQGPESDLEFDTPPELALDAVAAEDVAAEDIPEEVLAEVPADTIDQAPEVAEPEVVIAESASQFAAEPVTDFTPKFIPVIAQPSEELRLDAFKVDDLTLADVATLPGNDLDDDLLPIFLEEGSDLFPLIGQTLRAWQQAPQDTEIIQSLLRLLHTVKGSARMAGAMALGQHTHDMESQIEHVMQAKLLPSTAIDDLLTHHDAAMQMFDELRNPPAPVITDAHSDADTDMPASLVSDAVTNVADITATPTNLVAASSAFTGNANAPAITAAQTSTAVAANANAAVALVRVRADILDRLVNQAGEVSISRSRLENEVSTLRSSLSELNENVSRLRDQLREVEIQAETQISSRMAMSGEREFDPLEFDRFTRLQELTRMMAESVNDVSTVQGNISKTVEGATDDLISQARLTRELQQDLMRVRMVPFASISERLYRITRQTSKELDKRVNLDIRGTSVEIDRSVLEKMAGPFEHLLRNAIVHGIESREQRQRLGKNEIGEILVQIRQEGNEVVINFNDDGQGLDLQRIRDKAQHSGLLAMDEVVTDSEAMNLIFESGFSTANEVTELAGRGVGMDVVRSEATALGGRVSIETTPNQGSKFTIHLPLTLAVTQVVLLNSGGKTYAVPSVLVEQVQQLKVQALATAYNDGAIQWQGQRVAMHYLPTVLGDYSALPLAQQYTPIVIMHSGNERVALHVDQVIGNREVVVKNIGQQLARMVGISGATVLGSGDIVLILNPLPLAQKMEHEMLRAPRLLQENSDTPQVTASSAVLGAVSEAATQQPVQGLRRHHIVMVVDDSLTVRKVSQRLLLREGYQVVLAKDGIDALQQLQAITPDVMLVDIEMPRMDGFDLTRNVRNDERLRHIPIIMITSRTADKHRNYAQELGVNAYFGKPFQEDALLESIVSFLPELNKV